jgi:hypothetical protein
MGRLLRARRRMVGKCVLDLELQRSGTAGGASLQKGESRALFLTTVYADGPPRRLRETLPD